jgi:hypothetical protein
MDGVAYRNRRARFGGDDGRQSHLCPCPRLSASGIDEDRVSQPPGMAGFELGWAADLNAIMI